MIFVAVVLFLVGLLLIWKGSAWATDSVAHVAKKLGTTHIAVGLILVSLLVTLPEMLVAVSSALQGHAKVGLGVIVGSVIANIGLVVGISAMIKPLKVSRSLILRDGIFAVCIAIAVLLLSADSQISRVEGWAFILFLIPYAINVWEQEHRERKAEKKLEVKEVEMELKIFGLHLGNHKPGHGTFLAGMVVLMGGSYLFSRALIDIAAATPLSEIVIGLSIGALGTSIPNIAAGIQATLKNAEGLAVSETLGSNVFTLLLMLGILAIISPITVASAWLKFDIPFMVVMSIALLVFMIARQRINRAEGFALFLAYFTFILVNVLLSI